MEIEYQWFVGIDWATEKNDVCIVDSKGVANNRGSIR